MVEYEVTVSTAYLDDAGTSDHVFIKLLGTDGDSERKSLTGPEGVLCFARGNVSSFTVSCPASIGELVLIELDKQPSQTPEPWFAAKIEVKSPEGNIYRFPIYCYITDSEVHRFREERALVVCETQNTFIWQSSKVELDRRNEDYRWHVYAEGLPHCMKADSISSLPAEVQFSYSKDIDFKLTAAAGLIELKLKGLTDCKDNWSDIDDIKGVFCCRQTDIFDYVQKHWKEDSFFGHQFLNGINPMMIQRCSVLPSNFPVTDAMVFPSGQFTLENEMKKGNIFLSDYKCLDGLKTHTIHKKMQYLTAPLVLLHKTPDDKLMPIAIQLQQTPADDNPIFLPTDSEYDWLMAKIFVRSADFNEHESNSHLLRTHLLAEVFTVSLLRNVSKVHPLHKLLVPHTRFTLQINFLARRDLISETGVFTKFAASGGEGMMTLLRRSLSSMTYSSLCIPDDIAERGLENVPNFYYREDGLKLWEIIHRFVEGVLSLYYENDAKVQNDSELQTWIADIFEHGFLSQANSGIPQKFTTVADMVKFVTMVIFTCSAQHSAVNAGQYDYGGWMPNTPISLQLPPPTTKGTTSEATMLQTLPDMGTTANGMAVLWLLSKPSVDFVTLEQYPKKYFEEEVPLQLIRAFQGELQVLSSYIKIRNTKLEVPYTYMDPEKVENSVAL